MCRSPGPCPAAHRQVPCGGTRRAAKDDIGLDGRRGPTPHPGAPATHSLGTSGSIFVPAFQSESAQGPVPEGCPVSLGGKGPRFQRVKRGTQA